MRVSLIAVDDASSELLTSDAEPDAASIEGVEILRLICNLGHQRAIAVGLAEVAQRHAYDAVIVMDCDGEDRRCDLVRLIDAHRMDRTAIIVAQRAKRSEGLSFRAFYELYKSVFILLTGRRMDFGNFLLIPRPMVTRLAHMPEIWNHLAAAVLRSRVRVVGVPTERGRRYAGNSSMNLVALLTQGLSAIAVLSDIVFEGNEMGTSPVAVQNGSEMHLHPIRSPFAMILDHLDAGCSFELDTVPDNAQGIE